MLSAGLRAELSHTDIKVSTVLPGGIATDIVKNSGVEDSLEAKSSDESKMKLTTPQDAAATIIKAIEKEKARVLIGKDAKFLDLYSRIAPIKAGRFIGKMMASSHSNSFCDREKLIQKKCEAVEA